MENNVILQQNKIVEQWTPKVIRGMKANATTMFPHGKSFVLRNNGQNPNLIKGVEGARKKGIKSFVTRSKENEPNLRDSVRSKLFRHYGKEIDGVSFTFARHGIFALKGKGPGTRHRITSYNVCYTKLLRYQLYISGFRYWFTDEEIKEIDQKNEEFTTTTVESYNFV